MFACLAASDGLMSVPAYAECWCWLQKLGKLPQRVLSVIAMTICQEVVLWQLCLPHPLRANGGKSTAALLTALLCGSMHRGRMNLHAPHTCLTMHMLFAPSGHAQAYGGMDGHAGKKKGLKKKKKKHDGAVGSYMDE